MVLVDGIVFSNTRQKGVQRYFYEMLSRAASRVEVALFLDEPQQAPIPDACKTIVRHEHFWTSRSRMPLWAWRRLRRTVLPTRLPRPSVFHTSYFTRSPVPGCPEVTTVYDMIFERMPYHYGPDSESQALQKAQSIRSAEQIIAISKSTADELVRFYPELRDKVTTIYPGCEHLTQATERVRAPASNPPYCLFVGYRFGYKNFTTVLDAMRSPAWNRDLRLHIVGSPLLASELMLIRAMGLDGRITYLGNLSDADLAEAYRNCAAFVFPSLAEGFGIPVLEAQSCGAPLVCSDIPVFREIAGEAAEFFDALDPESLAAAMNRATAAGAAAALKPGQAANLARFSWERCASETIRVWEAAAQ